MRRSTLCTSHFSAHSTVAKIPEMKSYSGVQDTGQRSDRLRNAEALHTPGSGGVQGRRRPSAQSRGRRLELLRNGGPALDRSGSRRHGSESSSPRSLQRRRSSGRLTRYESDRLYRLAHIVALANESLGDHERAMRWFKRPNRALGGMAPVAAIDTELGARQVENILGRIAYGGVS